MSFASGQIINEYIIEKQIGKGSFSEVYLAHHSVLNVKVAIKRILKSKFPQDCYEREVNIHSKIDHPFATAFFSTFEDQTHYYIVMEYASGGSLLQYITQNGRLDEYKARHIFTQLISLLHYLHTQKQIVHRDIKLENIMLDDNGNIRLIDFGLGNEVSSDNNLFKTACGSLHYASPEMVSGQKYSFNSDIWAAGCVLYILVVGKMPFDDQNTPNLMKKILYQDPYFPEDLSPELLDLLRHCLLKDRVLRYSEIQIVKHPWICDYQDVDPFMNDQFVSFFDLSYQTPNNQQVLTKLELIGFPSEKVIDSVENGLFDKYSTAYFIIQRLQKTSKLKFLCSMPSEPPQKIRRMSLAENKQNGISTSNPNISLREMATTQNFLLAKTDEGSSFHKGRTIRRKQFQMSQNGRKFGQMMTTGSLLRPGSIISQQNHPHIIKPMF